jgi:hypothetical protein
MFPLLFVPGLLDDHLIDGLPAERELLGGGAGARRGPFFEMGQHGLHFVVVLLQDLEHVSHLSLPKPDLLVFLARDRLPGPCGAKRHVRRPPVTGGLPGCATSAAASCFAGVVSR